MRGQLWNAFIFSLGAASVAQAQEAEAPTAPQPPSSPSVTITPPMPAVIQAPAPPPPRVSEPLRLTGSRLYVYDFLDWHKGNFTDKVIDEFEGQLATWLGAKAEAVTISRSADLPLIKKLREESADDWTTSMSGSQLRQTVPVIEAIQSNKAAEEAVSANYRLVIFPSSFSSQGAWRYYVLRWVVYRVSDNRSWQYLYDGSHMVLMKEGERAKSRSRKFIEAADTAMKQANLFAD